MAGFAGSSGLHAAVPAGGKGGNSGGVPVAKPVQVPAARPVQVPHSAPAAPAPKVGGVSGGHQLLRAAKQLAAAQYNPVINQYASQIAAQNKQTAGATNETEGYYSGLANYLQGLQAQTGQTGSALASQLAGIGAAGQSSLSQIGSQEAANTNAYAPPGDPSVIAGTGVQSQLASQIAQMQGLQAQQTTAGQQLGAQSTANYQGLLGALQGAGTLQAAQGLGSLQAARSQAVEPLNADIEKAGTEKANATGANYQNLLKQEATNRQQNVVNEPEPAETPVGCSTAECYEPAEPREDRFGQPAAECCEPAEPAEAEPGTADVEFDEAD